MQSKAFSTIRRAIRSPDRGPVPLTGGHRFPLRRDPFPLWASFDCLIVGCQGPGPLIVRVLGSPYKKYSTPARQMRENEHSRTATVNSHLSSSVGLCWLFFATRLALALPWYRLQPTKWAGPPGREQGTRATSILECVAVRPTLRGKILRSADLKRGQRESGNVKKSQKSSKSVKNAFRHFATFLAQGKKTSKIVKKFQKYFRHFSTIFAQHQFSGPFWGALIRDSVTCLLVALYMHALQVIQYRTGVWKCLRSLPPDPSPGTG